MFWAYNITVNIIGEISRINESNVQRFLCYLYRIARLLFIAFCSILIFSHRKTVLIISVSYHLRYVQIICWDWPKGNKNTILSLQPWYICDISFCIFANAINKMFLYFNFYYYKSSSIFSCYISSAICISLYFWLTFKFTSVQHSLCTRHWLVLWM